MNNIKFLCSGSPRFKVGGESFQAKNGFNEMPEKFKNDTYFDLCLKSGIIKDFVSAPSDKQQEDFVAQIQAERERADALQKELDELKAKKAEENESEEGKANDADVKGAKKSAK